MTTLVDPLADPAEAIAALLLGTLERGTPFQGIKITLALDVLRCLTPAMIEKELLLHIIAYNLIHSLMQRAATSFAWSFPA